MQKIVNKLWEYNIGGQLYNFAKIIFKIPRSLSGDGNKQTLKEIDKILDNKLKIHEVTSGTKAYD